MDTLKLSEYCVRARSSRVKSGITGREALSIKKAKATHGPKGLANSNYEKNKNVKLQEP